MSLTTTPTAIIVVTACFAALLTACGADTSSTPDDSFCDTMEKATTLLQPETGSATPETTRVRYDDLASILAAAQDQAPTSIAADVAAFANAVEQFAFALAAVDYDIDHLFRTPAGVQLGEQTSHALTPAVIEHLTRTCGLILA